MSHEIDVELLAAIHAVVAPAVRAALVHGPLPAMSDPQFAAAPEEVRRAVLLVLGSAWVFAGETVDSWLDADYCGGRYHREHLLPAITELDKLRWPPTGSRDLWVRFGPDGPPPELEAAA